MSKGFKAKALVTQDASLSTVTVSTHLLCQPDCAERTQMAVSEGVSGRNDHLNQQSKGILPHPCFIRLLETPLERKVRRQSHFLVLSWDFRLLLPSDIGYQEIIGSQGLGFRLNYTTGLPGSPA